MVAGIRRSPERSLAAGTDRQMGRRARFFVTGRSTRYIEFSSWVDSYCSLRIGYGLMASPFHHRRSGAEAEDGEVQVRRIG